MDSAQPARQRGSRNEAEQDARPNDEERGQPLVPSWASVARSSSSVSFTLAASTMRSWRPVVAIVCVTAFGIGVFLVRDYRERQRGFAERTSCVGTLTRLRLAKAMYAQDHGFTNGAVIPEQAVWHENGMVEHCPSGGRYSINIIGVDPSCSHTEVVRWSKRLWRHSLTE